MKRSGDFNVFSVDEQKYYLWFRHLRDQALHGLANLLLSAGVTPFQVTLVGVLAMVPFALLFQYNPWFSLFFLIFSVLCDALDGVMARISGKNSVRGSFIDFSADHFVYFVVFFTFLWFGLLSSFWASLHLANYLVMIFLVFFANMKRIEVFPVIRSKLLVYLVFLIWLVSGNSYFDPLLVMMTVYMLITNSFLFIKIQWEL